MDNDIRMPGYWRRPIARVYSYNLDLGENYYSPMKVRNSISITWTSNNIEN